MVTAVKTEGKKQSQRDKILNLLREAGENGVTNTRFQQVCIRWDARIREMYQEGYSIKVEATDMGGVYRYTLLKEPEQKADKPKHAVEVLMDEIYQKHNGYISAEDLAELFMKKRLNVVRSFGYHKKA